MKSMESLDERTEDGASAVEYGLLIAGIAGLIILVVWAFGGTVANLFASTCNHMTSQITTSLSGSSCS